MRFLFSLGACLILLLAAAYFFYGLQPVSADKGKMIPADTAREITAGQEEAGDAREGAVTQFTIIKGEGFREIGSALSRARLIRSISVFKLYTLLAGRAQKFQPGAYDLSPAMSVPEIVRTLTSGSNGDVLVTIPEGSALKDIDAILAEKGVIRRGALISLKPDVFALEFPELTHATSLEGLLFPDTYYFSLDASAESVARRMLENFMRKGMSLVGGARDWYETVILASLLEREVASFADRQLVAGILLKRVRIGMPLQVDATVSYGKCGGGYRECEDVTVARNDLSLDSPYNTYARRGFPPTPIASPGAHSLRAAATPAASSYLYYLSARDTKETIFARTLEEHNANHVKYL